MMERTKGMTDGGSMKTDKKPTHTKGPSFEIKSADRALIADIAGRAVKLAREYDVAYDFMSAAMDITACHANGNPLRLQDLLDADDGNFGHDVFGIRRHLDRETGKLEGFFSPRFSLRAAISKATNG